MKTTPIASSRLPSSDDEKHFFEVTFLNKISLVFLNQCSSPTSRVDRIKQMLLDHFKIETALICQVHLIDIKARTFVCDDTQLEKTRYYLAFSRLGNTVSQEELNQKNIRSQKFPLLGKRLFQRVTSSLTIKATSRHVFGRVEVLEPDKTRKMEYQFLCPFLDCAKVFKRSCDLLVHFRVETGERPFQCGHCKKLFRRKILLTKHLSCSNCSKDAFNLQLPDDATPAHTFQQIKIDTSNKVAINKRNNLILQKVRSVQQKREALPRHSHALDIWQCSSCKNFFSNPMTLLAHSKDCGNLSSPDQLSLRITSLSHRIIKEALIQVSKNEICSKLLTDIREVDMAHRLLLCSQILCTSALMGVLNKLMVHY